MNIIFFAMKSASKILRIALFVMVLAAFSTTYSCNKGVGCEYSQYKAKADKNGNLSSKRGKSSLFDKKMYKK